MIKTSWVYDDGGRAESGFKGDARDCVTRAIAIATGLPYKQVYEELASRESDHNSKRRKHKSKTSSPRNGVSRDVWTKYLGDLGWTRTTTMGIGTGCQVHLRPDELPSGRIIVQVTKHVTAVIDGVVHDTHDSTRDGTRCVYGYHTKGAQHD